jgi:hypothetical protein
VTEEKNRKDNRYISEKIFDNARWCWAGYCMAWFAFRKPEFWNFVLVFFVGTIAIAILDIIFYGIQVIRDS